MSPTETVTRSSSTTTAAKNITKNIAKNITKATTAAKAPGTRTAYTCVAKAVVVSLLLLITEDFIGLLRLFELVFGVCALWITVGVIFHRDATKGLFDLLF